MRCALIGADTLLIECAKMLVDCGGAPIDHLAVHQRVDGGNFSAEMPKPELGVPGKFTAACGSWIAVAAILTRFLPNDHESMTPRS